MDCYVVKTNGKFSRKIVPAVYHFRYIRGLQLQGSQGGRSLATGFSY